MKEFFINMYINFGSIMRFGYARYKVKNMLPTHSSSHSSVLNSREHHKESSAVIAY